MGFVFKVALRQWDDTDYSQRPVGDGGDDYSKNTNGVLCTAREHAESTGMLTYARFC